MEKINIFKKELDLIVNSNIRKFTEKCLEEAPDYFFSVPASSTGKYHPSYALGEGGLVRHTQAATRIAYELFRIEFFKYTNDEKDIILSSLILHDICKSGREKTKFTITEHPLVASELIKSVNFDIKEDYKELIANNIATHMGYWNKDYKTNREVLPVPKSQMQKFVHICDYLASRKCLEFNFDIELSK